MGIWLCLAWTLRYRFEIRAGENWKDGNLLPDDGMGFWN